MIRIATRRQLRAVVEAARREGARVGFVPTMGYLHEGHLSLVDIAREAADRVVVSIFVNPLQFGAGEDLDSYPRDLERDAELLEVRGTDVLFAPAVEEMYPGGPPRITVDPGPLAERLCGLHRPGHFRGVLTVVARLFGLVQPDIAVFGRKDFQQAVLIRQMVEDMEMPVEILTGPVVREADGLAMSSRNAYLSPEERAQAPGLYAGLRAALERFQAGERRAAELLRAAAEEIGRRPLLELQYLEVVDPRSLDPVDPVPEGAVLAVAAFCGSTRLIDNVELRGPAEAPPLSAGG